MGDGDNGLGVMPDETPALSPIEGEIQAELDQVKATLIALRSARIGSDAQPYEAAESFLCNARTLAREASVLPVGMACREKERLATVKLQAARNVLNGGKVQ